MKPNSNRRAAFERVRASKTAPASNRSRAGIGPNKAAGSKGGIRRQGSKR